MEGNETTKIYCSGRDGGCNNDALYALLANNKNGVDPTAMMMANNGGFGGNNGLMWLLAFLIFGQNGFGNGMGRGGNNAQLAQVQNQLSDNQNSTMIMDAIRGNTGAIDSLAKQLNCDINAVDRALCDMKAQLAANGVQINYAAERVENAVNMGDCHVIEAVNKCCCDTQKELIRQSGENRLAMCQQTNVLQNGQRDIQVIIDKAVATSAFETKTQTCDLINNQNANTQRIIDKLDANKMEELQRENLNLRTKLSQCDEERRLGEMLDERLKRFGGCGNNRGGCCDGWNY